MSRTDKIRQVAQQAHDNGDCECVTITISREDAEFLTAMTDLDGNEYDLPYLARIEAAAQAALEGER